MNPYGSFGDRKPYGIPSNWEDLRGPSAGVLHLPLSIDWSPTTNDYDLSDPGQVAMAYRSILSEGTVAQVCEMVNGELLEAVWPSITLPRPASAEWHGRFGDHLPVDPMRPWDNGQTAVIYGRSTRYREMGGGARAAQDALAKTCSDFLSRFEGDFALAGSGALRAHGIIDRDTRDIDVFGDISLAERVESFEAMLPKPKSHLESTGYAVEVSSLHPRFASIVATKGSVSVQADFGLDYREHDPVTMEVGEVIDDRDASASKISTIFSRSEPRDFLDATDILKNKGIGFGQAVEMASGYDAGITRGRFAEMLGAVNGMADAAFAAYGASPEKIAELRRFVRAWSDALR